MPILLGSFASTKGILIYLMGLFGKRGIETESDTLYVKKEKIVESAVTGKAVKALCGKKWIPSRDPEKYPICPTCKEIYAGLKPEPEDK